MSKNKPKGETGKEYLVIQSNPFIFRCRSSSIKIDSLNQISVCKALFHSGGIDPSIHGELDSQSYIDFVNTKSKLFT